MQTQAILAVIEGAFRLAQANNISFARLAREREEGTLTPERIEQLYLEAIDAVNAIGGGSRIA